MSNYSGDPATDIADALLRIPRRKHRPRRPGSHGLRGGPALMRLLLVLQAAARSLSVSEIGEAIGVDQPRASRLVAQCADAGLVQREVDPKDGRRSRVTLTADGLAYAIQVRDSQREMTAAALAGFSPEDRADLARLLTKFADAWPSVSTHE